MDRKVTAAGSSSSTTNKTGSSNNSNPQQHQWMNPSIQHQQKYNIRPLPSTFVPTKEEQQLLDMYEVIRSYERIAARIKEENARAKLLAKDAEFQQQQQQQLQQNTNNPSTTTASSSQLKKTNKRQRKPKKTDHEDNENVSDDDDDDDEEEEDVDMEDDYDDEEDDDEEQTNRAKRREAKLAALREEVEVAKKTIQQATENSDLLLREQHLTQDTTYDDEPMLKKKRKDYNILNDDEHRKELLIANLQETMVATPTHDFSQSYQLSTSRGTVLFPRQQTGVTTTIQTSWNPPTDGSAKSPNDDALELLLHDFDIARAQNGSGNNTIAIKCSVPTDAKRFSINIAGPDHNDYESVVFHFNPRQRERGGQLIVNDKQETVWGHALSIPLSQVPLMFGQTAVTIMIQINGEGYDIFIENVHCARLEHRTELPMGTTDLYLQFPSTDDYGVPENWTVYKVWWGNRPIMAKGDVSGVPGVNTYNSDHPRKLFISNLPKIYTDAELDVRRAELERAFKKYGGERGVVQVFAPQRATYAFIEMESEDMTDLALIEMKDKYRMNRARRSRHEALREERAASAAAAAVGTNGGTKTGSAWD